VSVYTDFRALLQKRNRWFDGCSCCKRPEDLVVYSKHEFHCPFAFTMRRARIRFGLYLVDVSEGAVPSPSGGEK